MELLPQYQLDPAALSHAVRRGSQAQPGGSLVPLKAVAGPAHETSGRCRSTTPASCPSVTISFNLKPGCRPGRRAMASRQQRRRPALPATISTQLPGHGPGVPGLAASRHGLLLVLAVLVIYMVLGILYESFIHPITILSALPFAGFGALLTLLLFHVELSLYAFVGIIMLVGLVKKNGIMMVDFALEARNRGGKTPAGRHPRGLHDPVPPDHDDHHGRPDGRPAHRPGLRRRRRVAPAAGPGRRRRPAVLARP